jgi:iron complex transport system substrate-binding protein
MKEAPSRIVSLTPGNTEVLYALGLGDRLVGVDDQSDYPLEARELPTVGGTMNVDLAKVAALRPDLVVASLGVPGTQRNLDRLEQQGIPSFTVDPKSLADVLGCILSLGEKTGREEAASGLVAELSARMEAVAELVAPAPARPRVYWEWWPKPFITPGRGSWVTDLIEMAGGVNVFGEMEQESVTIDEDMVFTRMPDVIIASWCGVERLVERDRIMSRRGWEILSAVQTGRVYVVEEDPFGRPGPRLMEGLERVARILHPELFPGR